MASRRPLLAWLCCVLVLCIGMPLRGSCAPAAGKSPTPSCCGTDACKCARACDCDGGKRREPQPAPQPAPRLLQAQAPEAMPKVALPPATVLGVIAPQRGSELPAQLLPGRSRQEALSVWRC